MCVGWSDWPLWHLSQQQQLVGTSGLWSSRSTSWSLSTCSDSRTCSKILQDSSFAIFHNRLPDRWTPYQIQQGSNFIWCEPYDINARAPNVSESHSDAQTKEPTCDSTQCDIPQLGLCTLRGCSTTFDLPLDLNGLFKSADNSLNQRSVSMKMKVQWLTGLLGIFTTSAINGTWNLAHCD